MSTSTARTVMLPQAKTPPFLVLLRFELRRTVAQRHVIALASMIAMGLILAFWLPMFPESVFRFFQRVFQLNSWAEIVFANELAGLFFFIYWIAVFDVLTIYVTPLEERQLDVVLSKPLSRRAYMLARLLPILLTAIGMYAVSVTAHWGALRMAGLAYPPGAFIGAGLAVLAWTLFLIGSVNFAILSARETYVALLIAFVPIAISLLPGMVYMYRPDVFLGAPDVRDLIVFPMNLVWYPDFAARWGSSIAALFLALAVAVAYAAGWRIERRDVV